MDDERSAEVNSVILKGIGFLVAFAVAVAVGTWIVVKVLGLNSDTGTGGALGVEPAPVTPLPSTALPTTGHHHGSGTGTSDTTGQGVPAGQGHQAHGLHMTMTPLVAQPMERLNITGTYAGHDNASLQVQRLEGGVWADFPTQAQVNMGTFETYVETSHTGPNKFRVYDPGSDKASNVVTISIR